MDVGLPAPEVIADLVTAAGTPAARRLLVTAGDEIRRCELDGALRTLAKVTDGAGEVIVVREFLRAWVHSYLGRPDAARLATEAYARARKVGSGLLQRAALTDLLTLLARHPDGQSPLGRLQQATGIATWPLLVPVARRLVGELIHAGARTEAIWSLRMLYHHRDTPRPDVFGAVARALDLALRSGLLTDEHVHDVKLLGWTFPERADRIPAARRAVARLHRLALRLAGETRSLRYVLIAARLRRLDGDRPSPADQELRELEALIDRDLEYRAARLHESPRARPSPPRTPPPRWYRMPPSRVYIGPVSYFPRGNITAASIQDGMRRSAPALTRCVAERALGGGIHAGRLVLEAVRGPDRLETVTIVEDTIGDAALRRCVVGVLSALRFPEVSDPYPARVVARLPLVLPAR
jgi:hypothetical protein